MKNKTVIITGASGNLGKEAIKKFSELGANVVAVSGRSDVSNMDGSVFSIKNIDLTKPEHAEKVITQTRDHFSKPDILINIAGGFIWKTVRDTTLKDFNDQFNLNFTTMYNMTIVALTDLEKSNAGRVINIGAIGAIRAEAGMAAYASSKSAVMRFTEALAKESNDNITVNAILPSIIDTPANRKNMPNADPSKWVTTTELVDVMVFLSSNEASGINGALLPIKGRL